MKDGILDISQHLELFNETIQIYRDSFPEWEREDEKNILTNIRSNKYKMFVLVKSEEVLGFSILDIHEELDYTLFAFLAIKESNRGSGLGSALCLDGVEYFHAQTKTRHLLIEAQPRQEKLYTRLGFHTLDIEYQSPKFNSTLSEKMSLMSVDEVPIEKPLLKDILTDIFVRGYSLNENDPRVQEQLARV